MRTSSVILAAGQGTRMKSQIPKMLHPILGRPLGWYAVKAAHTATGSSPVVVVGHGSQAVQAEIGDQGTYVIQEKQLGTGHAVQQAEPLLRGKTDTILVTYGDMPLIRASTLSRLLTSQAGYTGPITMLTVISEDPRGFGRILRRADGSVQAIVEEVQATPEQLAIRELNPGVYCFDANWLWNALTRIVISPKGEYYLTDLVGIAVNEGLPVQTIQVADPTEMIGINTRAHLVEATAIMRRRINQEWLLAGVTILDPETTYIEPGIPIGQDTVIWPNTYLQGETEIGAGCSLGPNAIIRDTKIGDRCKVFLSVLEAAVLEDEVDVGPFGHLRKGTHLAQGVHMGNFGEVKNSYLGPGTKMGHFSYLGDATIGQNVNIGAGTITCNFDGEQKHHTEIGADAFIGSDTMLVAPLTIGAGARTGAGSVVTKDVPADTLAVGIPARAIRKINTRQEQDRSSLE
jgi:bifunctional UDP-N-acetylglucosamine pyrophosphorylase/glucosamine-1-phosphate N-acetyltransferase